MKEHSVFGIFFVVIFIPSILLIMILTSSSEIEPEIYDIYWHTTTQCYKTPEKTFEECCKCSNNYCSCSDCGGNSVCGRSYSSAKVINGVVHFNDGSVQLLDDFLKLDDVVWIGASSGQD